MIAHLICETQPHLIHALNVLNPRSRPQPFELTMGVKDFHIHTRHYITPVHISKYRGCRVGCDASGWLFRGLTPYAYEVLTNQSPWAGREDPPWVSYAMRMVYQLKDAGVEPVVSL